MQPTGKYDKIKSGYAQETPHDCIPEAQLRYEPTAYYAFSDTGVEFSEMLGLHITAPSDRMRMDKLAINTQYSFGDTRHTRAEKEYEISLRSVRVVLDLVNADILGSSQYTKELETGEFSQKKVTVRGSGSKANSSVDCKLGLKANILGLPVSPNAETSASVERGRSNKSNEETVTETSRTYKIFCPCGAGIWRIGGDHGDPRQYSEDLRDPIKAEPLCIMMAQDFSHQVSGILSIQASKTDFIFNVVGNDTKVNPIFRTIKSLGYNTDKQRILAGIDRDHELRKRTAALAAIKSDLEASDQKLDTGQICTMRVLSGRTVLASAKFSFIVNNGGERV